MSAVAVLAKAIGRDPARLVWSVLLVTAAVEAFAVLLHLHVPVLAVLLLAGPALVSGRIVATVKPPQADAPLPGAGVDPRPADRPFRDVTRMEERLAWGSVDVTSFDRVVRPLLVRLADERLLQRHGITRTAHPDQARELLGEDLWQLMTGPRRTSKAAGPTPAQLRALVERLESL